MWPTYLSVIRWEVWPIVGGATKVFLKTDCRGVLQDFIPNVGKLEVVYIPVKV